MIRYVKRYLELGFVIHPCCPASHRCQSPGKIPFDPVEGKHMERWQEHVQFGLDQWQEWCDYDSELNIGFLCGSPSNLVGIDVDSEEGQVILERSEIDGWRDTWKYTTGRGSRFLFRVSEATRSFNVTRGSSFIEVLGDGRQSVLPPSVHPSGRKYQWCAGHSPRDRDPADGAVWLGRLSPTVEITSETENWEETIQKTTPEGGRNESLTRMAGHLMNAVPTPPEEVYIWLSLYNQRYCKPPLPDRELRTIIKSIGKREMAAAAVKDREVKEIAKTYDVSYQDAEMMWRSR